MNDPVSEPKVKISTLEGRGGWEGEYSWNRGEYI